MWWGADNFGKNTGQRPNRPADTIDIPPPGTTHEYSSRANRRVSRSSFQSAMTIQSVEALSASPSMRVVDAVANETDTDPTELTPLGTVIDPEALDTLLADRESRDVAVDFEYEGCRVSIGSDQRVQIESLDGGH